MEPDHGCFWERNSYGFRQKRIYQENLEIPIADKSRGLEMKEVLNPRMYPNVYGR